MSVHLWFLPYFKVLFEQSWMNLFYSFHDFQLNVLLNEF